MSDPLLAHNESLLQWIWQELQFNCSSLKTTCGKSIGIVHPGSINHGAGPDFLSGELFIDGMDWHGHIEIHTSSKDWVNHGHHRDRNYNNVILHVVGDNHTPVQVSTEDGHKPFTLCIAGYLEKDLVHLVKAKQRSGIPCGAAVQYINQAAFEAQIDRAHREYFDYKVDEIISAYPTGVPISKAWKESLLRQIYVTLGVSQNKSQMGILFDHVNALDSLGSSREAFEESILEQAFGESSCQIDWTTTGLRPANNPVIRVRQAAGIHYAICQLSLKRFTHGVITSWEDVLDSIPVSRLPGRMMLDLLFYIAYLPGMFLLGKLLYSKALMADSYEIWRSQSQDVPQFIQKKFRKAGFSLSGELKKLGLVHQYKRYCMKKNCIECKVFKKAIRS